MAIRVAVSGTGRMGREVLAALCREPDLEPVAVVSRSAREEYLPLPDDSGLVPFGPDPLPLFQRSQPQVVVDFSHADFTPRVARAALEVGARPVIGTSGLSDAFLEELGEQCRRRRLGAIVAANFAIGGVLMVHLAKIAAPFFETAEIIEMHHDQKADAPSGTALATARAMARARGRPFRRPQTQRENLPGTRGGELEGITVHSVRLPGLVAHQEVLLGGPGQLLTIRHDSLSRESFIPGVLLAVRRVLELEGLVVGMEGVLGLE